MNKTMPSVLGLAILAAVSLAKADGPGSYAGQETREIKALAPEDVEAYLAGKGMGLAKAAELNGYPGPSHVLALADALALSASQKERTEALFKLMEARSKVAGRELIDEERRLDQLFASKAISQAELARSLQRIGELQAQVRQAHLESHLAQAEILTPAQTAAYMGLRGYEDAPKSAKHAEHKH